MPNTMVRVGSIKVIDLDVILACSKVVQHERLSIALNVSWVRNCLLPIIILTGVEITLVSLRVVLLSFALTVLSLWPKSCGVLVALDHNILFNWVGESNKGMGLASTFVNTMRSFDRANFPISGVRNS